MRATAWLIGPLFLALMIVIAAHPVQRWARRKGWPTWAATLALIVVVYVGLLALAAVLIVSVGQLATVLPQYSAQFDAMLDGLRQTLAGFGVGPAQIQAATQGINLNSIAGLVGDVLAGVSGLASVIVLILALLLFFIADAATFDKRLDSIAGDRPHIVGALDTFARGTRSYLFVTTVFGFIVAVLDTIALEIMGVPLAILWGVLAFITNYIPNIGFIFGLIPPAILALLTGGWSLFVIVIVVYCLLNLVIQSLIQPRFIGDSVGSLGDRHVRDPAVLGVGARSARGAAGDPADPPGQGPARRHRPARAVGRRPDPVRSGRPGGGRGRRDRRRDRQRGGAPSGEGHAVTGGDPGVRT